MAETKPNVNTLLLGIARKTIGALGIIIIIVVLAAGFLGYFCSTTDSQSNIIYDGLGRRLYLAPFIARHLLGAERLWPGFLWFIGDTVIFLGGMLSGYLLVAFGFTKKTDSQETN